MSSSLMKTYAPLPVTFQRGEGVWIWDTENNRYLDALCGIAVTGLGHAHPQVTQALCEQAGQLIHTSNLYGITHQHKLGDKLVALAGMERVFFSNSGAEANEAAIKLARLFGHQQDIDVPAIVVTEGSFHGRTMATLSATGNRKIQAGFEPLVPGFIRVPYNDLDALKAVAGKHSDVVAVMVEPIQGEGGINIPDKGYLSGIRRICDDNGWLMILDEIQTGMGRSGKWFAFQHEDLVPDVMTLAKALGNGVPIGACLARGAAAEVLQPGTHGSTFGGNPLMCRTALAVIEAIESSGLVARAQAIGERMLAGFGKQLVAATHVVDIRAKGLLIGIELDQACGDLVKQALAERLLINVTANNVIRLLPPLILSDEQADTIVDKVCSLIKAIEGSP